jgi:hypothetical protein
VPIKTMCPGCGISCTAPDHLHGKTIQCKRCATSFAIGSQAVLHEDPPKEKPAFNPLPPGRKHSYRREAIIVLAVAVLFALLGVILKVIFYLKTK